MQRHLALSLLALTGGLCQPVLAADGDVSVSGERKRWHQVTLTLDGPAATTNDADNPFLNRRFNVTFKAPSTKAYVVPGYFAGNGAGGAAGDRWVAHLNPSETGVWTYTISFRSGTDLAVSLDAGAGTALTPFNGVSGSFTIAASDKSGADFRAADKGMLTNRGNHYLTYAASGKPFVWAGPGIPENILGYRGFTNTTVGIGHVFDAHLADWKSGDPDWGGGQGKRLIGALNYIADHGGNTLYLMSNTIGGDGKDCFPHPTTDTTTTRFDLLKLQQWDIALAHAQRKGIYLHWVLAENEVDNYTYYGGTATSGSLSTARKLNFRMLNACFGHYNGLKWNLMEEVEWNKAERAAQAAYMKAIDPYDHPVTYQAGGAGLAWTTYDEHLGNGNFDALSFQGSLSRAAMFDKMKEYRDKSATAGVKWTAAWDEPQKIENDNTDDVNGYPMGRRDKMWPCLMGGGDGFLWYIQADGGGHGFDQRIEDFSIMQNSFRWSGYARDFLLPLPLLEMQPSRSLTTSTTGEDYTLAKPGEVYAIFNDRAGTGMSLDLGTVAATVSFSVQWFDPRNGGALQNGSVTTITGGGTRNLGSAPNNTGLDWAVLVQRLSGNQAPIVSAGPNRAITLPAVASLDGTVHDDGLPSGATLITSWLKISGPGTVTFANKNAVDTTAAFSVAGTYVLRLRANDTDLIGRDDVQVVVTAAGTNAAPIVSAGPDLAVTLPTSAALNGSVSDDGLPSGATVTTAWTKVSGPGTVSFGNTAAIDTTAGFSAAGTYVLRLTAQDSLLSMMDEVQVVVAAAPTSPNVTDFTLINADTDLPVAGQDHLLGAVTLMLADLPANLALRANAAGTVGSVRFGLDANAVFSTESIAPYAVWGDTSGNYKPWTLSTGLHTITATAYSGSAATGTAGPASTLTLTLVATAAVIN